MRVLLCCVVGIFLLSCSGGGSKDKSVSAGELLKAINDYRVANGLGTLTWKDSIATVATNYAEYLNNLRKTNPSQEYEPNRNGTPASRLSGLYTSWCGEAGKRWKADNVSDVLNNLDNKAVLLSASAKSIGIGRVP
ncbi:MAG: CAP domain-containing protein [Planctomycetota bacterium]|nr:CAP domain-containing protein [Planctomycetota bacterium]